MSKRRDLPTIAGEIIDSLNRAPLTAREIAAVAMAIFGCVLA